ncbi:MAG: hypothetical protein ACJA1C_001192 [Crocinitomicaceae bacterium]|jgi:hypothetical protein
MSIITLKKSFIMKVLNIIIFSFLSLSTLYGQNLISNYSFENLIGADLSDWQSTCGSGSTADVPSGGGNWCINVPSGSTQGCLQSYAYQKLPTVTNGQTFTLSGWAKTETTPQVGLYFGKINNGIITLQSGDTTSSTSWVELSTVSSFNLSAGDTAIVVLNGGINPSLLSGYGFFDLIHLDQLVGLNPIESDNFVSTAPNPFSESTTLKSVGGFTNATLTINNYLGQTVRETEQINGKAFTLHRNELPGGIYYVIIKEDNKVLTTQKLIITNH